MQIILCSRRRSASGKRAIWRAKGGLLKKASGTVCFPSATTFPYRYEHVDVESRRSHADSPHAELLATENRPWILICRDDLVPERTDRGRTPHPPFPLGELGCIPTRCRRTRERVP